MGEREDADEIGERSRTPARPRLPAQRVQGFRTVHKKGTSLREQDESQMQLNRMILKPKKIHESNYETRCKIYAFTLLLLSPTPHLGRGRGKKCSGGGAHVTLHASFPTSHEHQICIGVLLFVYLCPQDLIRKSSWFCDRATTKIGGRGDPASGMIVKIINRTKLNPNEQR